MLKNLKAFHYPEKLADAVALLDRLGPRGAVIAGGTTVTRMANPTLEALVDISRLELDAIRESKAGIVVGATATFQAMSVSRTLQAYAGGLLARAASLVSTRLIRNVGTIGGDIVMAYPYNDMPVALLALDAAVTIVSRKGTRTVPFALMLEEHPWRFVGKRSLLTEIRPSPKMAGWGSSYQRFARAYSEWEAAVLVAVTVEREDGSIRSSRISVGAVTRRAARFPKAEELLRGQAPTKDLRLQAARAVADGLSPLADWRSSKEHRLEVTRALVARALDEAFASAGR